MSDNGGVYRDQDFIDCLVKNRIEIGRLAAYTPTQNKPAEFENRILIEMARTMLLTKRLTKCFWDQAVNCSAYILNHTGNNRE